MGDERLIELIKRWYELSWYDRKRIWWLCFKRKYGITGKQVISQVAVLSMFIIAMSEDHHHHKIGLLAIIVLSYFYTMFIDDLLNRGKLI